MIDTVFNKVFAEMLPYLAPLLLLVTGFIVADHTIDMVRHAITLSSSEDKTRRTR